jgi:hypothetical protein
MDEQQIQCQLNIYIYTLTLTFDKSYQLLKQLMKKKLNIIFECFLMPN